VRSNIYKVSKSNKNIANLPELINVTKPIANIGASGSAFLILAAKNNIPPKSPSIKSSEFWIVKLTIPSKDSAAASLIVLYTHGIGEFASKLFGRKGIYTAIEPIKASRESINTSGFDVRIYISEAINMLLYFLLYINNEITNTTKYTRLKSIWL
jgi:hypothetical protein